MRHFCYWQNDVSGTILLDDVVAFDQRQTAAGLLGYVRLRNGSDVVLEMEVADRLLKVLNDAGQAQVLAEGRRIWNEKL